MKKKEKLILKGLLYKPIKAETLGAIKIQKSKMNLQCRTLEKLYKPVTRFI
jgi:hypothetical protein